MGNLSTERTDEDTLWGCFLIVCGLIFVGFIVFIVTVVGPSHDRQREACEAKGGVLVGKYHDCIKKEYVL